MPCSFKRNGGIYVQYSIIAQSTVGGSNSCKSTWSNRRKQKKKNAVVSQEENVTSVLSCNGEMNEVKVKIIKLKFLETVLASLNNMAMV